MGGGTLIIGNDGLRRMAARTLRGSYLVRDIGGYSMTHGTFFGMHLVAKNERDLRKATKSLADLIDPEQSGLVHCKDCRYGKAVRQIGCIRFHDLAHPDGNRDPDGYCAWGERDGVHDADGAL